MDERENRWTERRQKNNPQGDTETAHNQMNTHRTNPDGDENQEATRQHEREVRHLNRMYDMECRACDGKGWYATGDIANAIQLQCQHCSGTGLNPKCLAQHPDHKDK